MTPTIRITSNYGFDHNWTLVAFGREFYLGQDVKFCHRVLGLDTRYIANKIGTNDMSQESARNKLARLIIKSLGITKENVGQIHSWALSAS